jgi:thiamine biosynthesis lipoprotein
MGTLFRITVALRGDEKTEAGRKALHVSRRNAREAARAAFQEVSRVERLFSTYLPDSAISRINQAASQKPPKAVKVSQEVFNLLHESVLLHRRSGGAFDITHGALARLWTPRGEKPRVPSAARIREALTRVGSQHLKLDYDEVTVRLARTGMSIGLGAIAKGYAVDQAVRVLRARKLSDFIVDGGGDLYVAGKHPDRPWRVGIKDPRKPTEHFASFPVTDKAVVTSGDYERYFVVEGKRYSHVLDPRTGRPAQALMSATVVAPKTVNADALATTALVLGPRKGYDFVTKFADTDCILVSPGGKVLISPGLRDKVKRRPVSRGE